MTENFRREDELRDQHEGIVLNRLDPETKNKWFEVSGLIDAHAANMRNDKVSKEHVIERFDKISRFNEEFKKKLSASGKTPRQYMLWHKLVGSTLPDNIAELDTPDHDLEKFIRSL